MSDLLGCICLYGSECTRNCRLENEPFDRLAGARCIQLRFDPAEYMNDAASIACEKVDNFELQQPLLEIVALEAWSDGLVKMWVVG